MLLPLMPKMQPESMPSLLLHLGTMATAKSQSDAIHFLRRGEQQISLLQQKLCVVSGDSKINNVNEVQAISDALDAAGAPAGMNIWAMIETPEAIFNVRSIAAHPRVVVLVMGTNDLTKELRAKQVAGRAPLLSHLGTALLAAREADKVILDGVYNDIKNTGGFLAECGQGADMGFDGKTLIHPDQVEGANDTWAPSESEVEHARRVIVAFDEALAAGVGVVQLDGRMIENLHVDNARRSIAIAEAIAALQN